MVRKYFLLVALCTASGSHAQPLPEAAIPALIKARVQDTQGQALVVGIIDGQGRRYYSYGQADPRTGRPADEHTVFGIASVTKLLTAALLADMVIKGEAGLDEPVQQLLPPSVQVPVVGNQPVRLVDLSLHLSGLPREMPGTDYHDVQSLYRAVSDYRTARAPGRFEYSNVGVSLLGSALAQRAGAPYDQLVTDRILRPLGMNESGFALTPALRAQATAGWVGTEVQPLASVPEAKMPSGGLYSSASDMLTFLGAAVGLAPTPLDTTMAKVRQPYADQPNVRLAWGFARRNGSAVWQHAGRIGGYNSFVAFDANTARGVVLLSNSWTTAMTDLGLHILNRQFKLQQFAPPATFVQMVETSDFRQVAAAYHALRHRDPDFYLEEGSVNKWGGSLLGQHRARQAVEVLQFNAGQHPKSANAFDSLGLAFEALGDRVQAIAAYRKVLELDPKAGNAARRLAALAASK